MNVKEMYDKLGEYIEEDLEDKEILLSTDDGFKISLIFDIFKTKDNKIIIEGE